MEKKPLRLGAAYHGNRMLHHAEHDLREMALGGMDLVLHMFSHTDWTRHKEVVRDMVSISAEAGLESWIDCWGLGGPPGEVSHFLAYYPDSHMILSDGTMDPVHVCYNSPDFRRFIREWIDAVQYLGVSTIFWDEPHMLSKIVDGKTVYSCACPRCRKLFEERYGRPMPEYADPEVDSFGTDSIVDFFRDVTGYSASRGMKNVVCVMLGTYGMSLEVVDRICSLPHMDNIGSDPYWVGAKKTNPELSVYQYVYEGTRENLRIAGQFQKDHNIWIQSWANPRGKIGRAHV